MPGVLEEQQGDQCGVNGGQIAQDFINHDKVWLSALCERGNQGT